MRIKIKGEERHEPFRAQISKENFIFCRVIDLSETIHTDQTGAFPHTSIQGNRYIMVGIHLDANYIFVEPMKTKTEREMMRAYQRIVDRMKRAGLGLQEHKLDNEASNAFKECITRNGMKYKLVPPKTTAATKPNAPSRLPRHILSRFLPASTTSSHCHFGANSSNRQNSP